MRPKQLWVDAEAKWMTEYPFRLERMASHKGFGINIWNIEDHPDYIVLHCMERLAKEKIEYGYKLGIDKRK